jgi:uncharacterized protein (DUF2336 family)
MAAEAVDVQELLVLARERSEQARSHLFEVMGDLFSQQSVILSAQERALMIDILEKLVREVSREVRSKLANRLASAPAVPRELAVMLANDDIDIASPILLGSPALRDVDLIEIIHNRSRQHLLAVAMRRDLSMPVSAALVETGHSDVILTLLSNQDARISEATLAYVVEQSRVNDEFQEPLIRRKDLPRSLGVRMSYWVSAAIRKAIIERFEIDAGEIDDLIEPTIKDEAAGIAQMQPAAPHPSAAEQLARSLKSSGRLSSSLMLQTLRRGEVALFEAMLAAANELRLSLVQRFLYEEGGSGLAVLAKAMRLSREEFSTIFLLTRRARSGHGGASASELGRAVTYFDGVAFEQAQKVLTYWRRDPEYLAAIRSVGEGAVPKGKSGE